ncbi:MAG: hypothetical protein NVS3B25_09850 [Hymenobacter sp.]
MAKPVFDPSQPFTASAKPKFDPSQAFQGSADAQGDEGPSELESVVRGGVHGLTGGWADEGAGALSAIGDKLKGDNRDFSELYKLERDDSRAKYKAAEEAHPLEYKGADVAGSLAQQAALVPLTGGLSLTPAGQMLIGGAQGVGDSESDTLAGNAIDGLKGAALSGLTYGAGHLAGKALGIGANAALKKIAPGLAEKLESLAQMQAYRAAGPGLRDFREVGEDGAKKVGKKLLDEGAIAFGDNVNNVAQKTEALRQKAGETLGGLRDSLDQAGAGVNAQDLAAHIDSTLADQPASLRDVAAKMQNEATALRGLGTTPLADGGGVMQRPISLSQMAEERGGLGKKINWGQRNADPSTEAYQKLYGAYSDAENAAAHTADPALAEQYLKAKDDYHLLNDAAGTSEDRVLRNQANRMVSPSDNLHAAAAIAAGHPFMGPVAAVANHMIKARAPASIAVAARGLAETLGKVGATAAVNPARLGQFGGVLARALNEGNTDKFNAIHYTLSSNPQYQKTVKDLQDGPEAEQ